MRRQLTHPTSEADACCVAATPDGWLAVHGRRHDGDGSVEAMLPDTDGAVREVSRLHFEYNGCALLPVPAGFLQAYTHPGQMSETNLLYVRLLHGRGRSTRRRHRLDDGWFARNPHLGWSSGGPLLHFTDALSRNLRAVQLDVRGIPATRVTELVQIYGVRFYSEWGDEVVWTTDTAFGHRGCLDSRLSP